MVTACALLLPAAAQADSVLPLPVPVRAIAAGSPLAPGDFSTRPFRLNAVALRRYVLAVEDLQGKKARVALLQGRPVALAQVELAYIVHKGVATSAQFRQNGIEISGTLIPLEDANANTTIEARNNQSGRVVKALVLADGTLQVLP